MLLILFVFSVFAGSPPTAPENNPCSGDIHKYCSGVVPGEGRLAQCMRQHASMLSSGCKKFGKEYEKKHPGVGEESKKG